MSNKLEILYEDNHIIVVVKPNNILSQSDNTNDIDMLTIIKDYIKEKYNKPGNVYLGLIHRLDRPVGGITVFAKTSKAASRLSENIRSGEFEKRYLAVTVGVPRDKKGILRNGLIKDEKRNIVTCVPLHMEGAKQAAIEYKIVDVKEGKQNVALLDVHLLTGRSHQARVQLNFINCPIFGDYRYGASKSPQGYNLALWAYELRFPHPVSKEMMVFRVNPPLDEVPWKLFDISTKLAIIK